MYNPNSTLGKLGAKLKPNDLGIITFLLLFGVTTFFSFQCYRLTVLDEERSAHKLVDAAIAKMNKVSVDAISVTELLAFLVKEYGIENNFNTVAPQIFETQKYIDAIELVPNGIICCIYPIAGNEEGIGFNVLEDEKRNREALKAITRKEFYFAGPLKLKQGGTALVGRLPIFINEKFWGFSSVLINQNRLLTTLGIDSSGLTYHLGLSKVNLNPSEEATMLSGTKDEPGSYSTEVTMQGSVWRFSATPVDRHKASRETALVFLLGLSLSVMGGAFARTMAKKPKVLEQQLKDRSGSLMTSELKYLDLFDNSPIMLFSVDVVNFSILDCNNTFITSLGYSRDEIWRKTVYEFYDPTCWEEAEKIKMEFMENGHVAGKELLVVKKNGERMHVMLSASAVRDENGIIRYSKASWQDITEKKMNDLSAEGEKKVLEIIAKGKSLTETLNSIALNFETYSPGAYCSILLLDSDGIRIRHGAGPSLPKEYNAAIDGLEIGPSEGSCGTAAFSKKQVIVTDIENDPRWEKYKNIAMKFGLKACWSTPILTVNDTVLGTFAIYYKKIKSPRESDLQHIDRASSLVKIALEKDRAEKTIQYNEKKFSTAFDSNVLGLVISNEERVIVEINTALATMLDSNPKDLIGRTSVEVGIINDEFVAKLEGPLRDELMKNGMVGNVESAIYLKDGRRIDVMMSLARIDIGGELHWLTTVNDISEKKKIEEALVKSERHLRTIIEVEPECIKVLDADGKVLEMNPAGLQMIGADSLDGIKGQRLLHLLLPEYKDQFIALTQNVFEGQSGTMQFRIKNLKGEVRWLETNAVPLRNSEGKITSLLGITRDISERKSAEISLTESLERNKAIVNGIPDLMLVVDANGVFVDYSTSLEVKLYTPPEDFIGKNLSEVLPADLVEENMSKVTQALTSGQLQEHSYKLTYKEGDTRSFDARYVKINKNQVLVIIRDVTELQNAQEEILRSKNALELGEKYARLGSWEISVGEGKTYWSKQMYRMCGFDPNEKIPTFEEAIQIVHPEDRGAMIETFNKIKGGEEPPALTFRTNPALLSLRYFKPSYSLQKDSEGNPIKFTGTLMDITSLMLREEALRESEKKYRTIFENTSEGIYRSTVEGELLLVNTPFANIFGYLTAEEMMQSVRDVGENMYAIPEERERFLSELLVKGSVFEMDVHGKTKLGKNIWITVNSHLVYGKNRTIEYVEGTIRNITETKNNRLKIEEQYEALRKYAFINSHRVRAHVATMLGLANLFDVDSLGAGERDKIVKMLRNETSQLDKVIRELSILINDVG